MEATARLADRQARFDIDIDVPLVVDLDQTLILTDSLQESCARLLFSKPFGVFASLRSNFQGRAAFKARIAEQSMPDVACLPYRAPAQTCCERKGRGAAQSTWLPPLTRN